MLDEVERTLDECPLDDRYDEAGDEIRVAIEGDTLNLSWISMAQVFEMACPMEGSEFFCDPLSASYEIDQGTLGEVQDARGSFDNPNLLRLVREVTWTCEGCEDVGIPMPCTTRMESLGSPQ